MEVQRERNGNKCVAPQQLAFGIKNCIYNSTGFSKNKIPLLSLATPKLFV
jgi:hypothetical protein